MGWAMERGMHEHEWMNVDTFIHCAAMLVGWYLPPSPAVGLVAKSSRTAINQRTRGGPDARGQCWEPETRGARGGRVRPPSGRATPRRRLSLGRPLTGARAAGSGGGSVWPIGVWGSERQPDADVRWKVIILKNITGSAVGPKFQNLESIDVATKPWIGLAVRNPWIPVHPAPVCVTGEMYEAIWFVTNSTWDNVVQILQK